MADVTQTESKTSDAPKSSTESKPAVKAEGKVEIGSAKSEKSEVKEPTAADVFGDPAEMQERRFLTHSTVVERTDEDGTKYEVVTDSPRDSDVPLGAKQAQRH